MTIGVRMLQDPLAVLDAWIAKQNAPEFLDWKPFAILSIWDLRQGSERRCGLGQEIRPPQLAASFSSSETFDVAYWHIASFRCAAEFGRYRRIADIDQASPIKLDL
jgi:hypothetical protein